MSLQSFNSRVGSGSLAHCLSGSWWMTRVSSSMVSEQKSSDSWNSGGTDVDATFASKNWWNVSAPMSWDGGRIRASDYAGHSRLGVEFSTRPWQQRWLRHWTCQPVEWRAPRLRQTCQQSYSNLSLTWPAQEQYGSSPLCQHTGRSGEGGADDSGTSRPLSLFHAKLVVKMKAEVADSSWRLNVGCPDSQWTVRSVQFGQLGLRPKPDHLSFTGVQLQLTRLPPQNNVVRAARQAPVTSISSLCVFCFFTFPLFLFRGFFWPFLLFHSLRCMGHVSWVREREKNGTARKFQHNAT